jgi:hypothetical protein
MNTGGEWVWNRVTGFWVMLYVNLFSVDLLAKGTINWIPDEFLATLAGIGVCDDLGPEQR